MEYINNSKEVDVTSVRKFLYIDDLITINNDNFEKNIQNIYPAELELNKENQINKNAKFLDLNTKIQNFRFHK